ncbi:hypothetical protein, conserved [Eimeria praecox]|uniref:Uncharacterized protein n=1 Tax=Eimeria praecox TaxID=51316 RepID=U6H608_9EIME|nr:hypothetical protein, conserved [Eimeria praecox]
MSCKKPIVDVILWGCMQSNVAEILDELVFGDVMPQQRDADIVLENVSPMLEVLFEELFFVAILLLVWYVVFVVLLQCLTKKKMLLKQQQQQQQQKHRVLGDAYILKISLRPAS